MKTTISFNVRAATLGAFSVLVLAAGVSAQMPSDGTQLPPGFCERVRPFEGAPLASPLDDGSRLAEIDGCAPASGRLIRRGGFPAAPSARDRRDFGGRMLPTSLRAVNRNGYPDDRNNGALWEGVGISSALRTGVQVWAPFVTLSLAPELLYHQNRDFLFRPNRRADFSEFSSPFYIEIDLPQRFGGGSWWQLVPGDSYLRFDLGWLAAGASTESLWRGPALRYPILMSNTAGGFPHLFLGTSRGVDIYVARLRAEAVLGRLTESEYFDRIDDNDRTRLINVAAVLDLTWPAGLSLGATRSYLYHPAGDDFDRLLKTLTWGGAGEVSGRPGNELASVFGRWVFEESGAEIYAEWARDDAIGTWREFVQEPDHAQAYMLGFQKLTALSPELTLRVHGELVHLQEKGEDRSDARPLAVLYTHFQVTQGYTHRGQMLGAGVGPGADAQFIGIDFILEDGMAGVYFERVRRNDLTPAALELRRWSPFEHDTEVLGGVRVLYLRDEMALSAEVDRSLRYNRDFDGNDRNWKIQLRLDWSPDLQVSR